VTIEYEGQAAKLNHKPLTAAMLAGLMSPLMEGVNMVNASVFAATTASMSPRRCMTRPTEYLTLVG